MTYRDDPGHYHMNVSHRLDIIPRCIPGLCERSFSLTPGVNGIILGLLRSQGYDAGWRVSQVIPVKPRLSSPSRDGQAPLTCWCYPTLRLYKTDPTGSNRSYTDLHPSSAGQKNRVHGGPNHYGKTSECYGLS